MREEANCEGGQRKLTVLGGELKPCLVGCGRGDEWSETVGKVLIQAEQRVEPDDSDK